MKRTLAILLAVVLLLCMAPLTAFASYMTVTEVTVGGNDYLVNLSLACSALDGVYVPAGSTFSFNDAVGPRTKEAGYKNAMNGRGANVRGGGVSQVATTLYLALCEYCDVTFSDLMFYGKKFVAGYCDPSVAVVTDYKNGHDLTFRNNGGGFYIYMWADRDEVCCQIDFLSTGSSNNNYSSGDSYYYDDDDFYYDDYTDTSVGGDEGHFFYREEGLVSNSGYDYYGNFYSYTAELYDGYYDIDVSSYRKNNSGGSVDGSRVVDGNTKTAWNTQGWSGEEYIHLFPDDLDEDIVGFCIVNGYAKNSDIYSANSRARTIEVWTGDACLGHIDLLDTNEIQYFYFSSPVGSAYAYSFYISSVYPGYAYDDVCISELHLLTE